MGQKLEIKDKLTEILKSNGITNPVVKINMKDIEIQNNFVAVCIYLF